MGPAQEYVKAVSAWLRCLHRLALAMIGAASRDPVEAPEAPEDRRFLRSAGIGIPGTLREGIMGEGAYLGGDGGGIRGPPRISLPLPAFDTALPGKLQSQQTRSMNYSSALILAPS